MTFYAKAFSFAGGNGCGCRCKTQPLTLLGMEDGMTIRRSINAKELNDQLGNLESCAEWAPEGTYENAKKVAALISDLADHIMHEISAAGFKVSGDDRMREVEAVIYGYLLANNPWQLATAEGFGERVSGDHPTREAMIAQAASNRDFLNSLLNTPHPAAGPVTA